MGAIARQTICCRSTPRLKPHALASLAGFCRRGQRGSCCRLNRVSDAIERAWQMMAYTDKAKIEEANRDIEATVPKVRRRDEELRRDPGR